LPVAAFNAAASARAGAEPLLFERYRFPGGTFTGWNVAVLTTRSVGGIGKEIKEIVDALMAQDAARRCADDPPNSPELPRTPPS
jgi:hypothetical protein